MRILTRTFTFSLLLASFSFADTITLRDGRTVYGSFLGGDARSIRVAVGDRVETFLLTDVANLSFDGTSASSPSAPAERTPRVFRPDNAPLYPTANTDASTDPNRPQLIRRRPAAQSSANSDSTNAGIPATPLASSTPSFPPVSSTPTNSAPASSVSTPPPASTDGAGSTPSQPPPPVYPPPPPVQQEIPAGAVLTIRMVDPVDSKTDFVGEKYRASLDADIQDTSGHTLVPRGADVVVKLVDDQQSGKIEGRTILTLDLVSVNINGRDVEINTSDVSQQSSSRGARSGKIIGGATALGAIVGAIAGGGKGAAIGAASGAGAGTAAEVMTKGQRVRIPSETKLSFTLQQPVRF